MQRATEQQMRIAISSGTLTLIILLLQNNDSSFLTLRKLIIQISTDTDKAMHIILKYKGNQKLKTQNIRYFGKPFKYIFYL